jgi:hypothetical protein
LSNEKTDYDKWCDIILGDAPANNVAKFANQKELAKARESIATLVLPDTAESIIARAFMRLQAADVPRDEWHWEVCQILNSPQVGSAVETTAKPLTCGCVVCTCEDEVRCHGCGAKYCEQHAVNTSVERHYPPCDVCGVGHDESTPHKSYLRCALCNSPMPNPVPKVRSCCEAGAAFDRQGFEVNR